MKRRRNRNRSRLYRMDRYPDASEKLIKKAAAKRSPSKTSVKGVREPLASARAQTVAVVLIVMRQQHEACASANCKNGSAWWNQYRRRIALGPTCGLCRITHGFDTSLPIWIGTYPAAFGDDQVLLLACIFFRENDGRSFYPSKAPRFFYARSTRYNVLCIGGRALVRLATGASATRVATGQQVLAPAMDRCLECDECVRGFL